jgi:hypothetical protein
VRTKPAYRFAIIPNLATTIKKIAFRFFCAFVLLYAAPFPVSRLVPWFPKIWTTIVPFVGADILRLPGPFDPGDRITLDTPFGFVHLLCVIVFAAIIAAVWTVARWRRPVDGWLRIYVRYYLAHALLFYAIIKFAEPQFPFPNLVKLDEPFGESSPMMLLWTFMGYSKTYTFFGGIAEALAAALLFFRRTTTLGAVLALGVMANVAMLDFSYGVPDKLYSSVLLLMILYLLLPDMQRLGNVFIFNRQAPPADTTSPRLPRWTLLLKAAIIAISIIAPLRDSLAHRRAHAEVAAHAPFSGIYDVDDFLRNSEQVTGPTRWRRAIFDPTAPVTVRLTNNTVIHYNARMNPSAKQMLLTSPTEQATFTWVQPDSGLLVFEGRIADQRVVVRMHRIDEKQFPLLH